MRPKKFHKLRRIDSCNLHKRFKFASGFLHKVVKRLTVFSAGKRNMKAVRAHVHSQAFGIPDELDSFFFFPDKITHY
jgi:hypothetical protein